LSNPLTYIFLRICLFFEATGVCSGAWVLAWIHKRIAGFQYDEVYIGTPEERAAKAHADKETELRVAPGLAGIPAHAAGEHVFNEEDYRFHSAVDTLETEVRDLRAQLNRMAEIMKAMGHDVDVGTNKQLAENTDSDDPDV